MKPKQTVFVPRLVKQVGPRCGVYALLMLVELLFSDDLVEMRLDARKFYKQLEAKGKKSNNYLHILRHAKYKGFYDSFSESYVKIKSYEKVDVHWIWRHIRRGHPLLLSLDVENGRSLNDRVDEDGRLKSRTRGHHAGVGIDVDKKELLIANTHGRKIPEHGKGYYWVPRYLFRKFVKEAYSIKI